jgi:anti-sigma regulatory factor (Ser/Thr protein kinase)
VAVARHLTVEAGRPYLSQEQLPKLELAVSEVVTNAVRYGESGDEIKLAVTPKDGYLCVQVTDSGPGLAPKPGMGVLDEDGGFGLFLVERLTRRWGITREERHTRVWFELDYA